MEQLISRSLPMKNTQSGVALIMVLIMLTAMLIAGVALIRVVDSANVISGNFAFRQATLNIADLGIEAAATELSKAGGIRATSSEAPYPAGCANMNPSNCLYFPARSVGSPPAAGAMLDSKGMPVLGNITGTTTQAISWSGNNVASAPRGYSIRYVIDRQCNIAPVTNVVNDCLNEAPQSAGSKKGGATVFSSASTIYYRVTVQVTGPKNTQSHVQAILGY